HKVFQVEPTQFNDVGKVMASPWKFKRHGDTGRWVSELFPHVATHFDDLAIVRSVVSKFPEHTSANYFLHTGSGVQGRPSMGAWHGRGAGAGYGPGGDSKERPGFIVLNGGLAPRGGLDTSNSGSPPAASQGSVSRAGAPPVANVVPLEPKTELQRGKLELLR